jgi:hypothetical protein
VPVPCSTQLTLAKTNHLSGCTVAPGHLYNQVALLL